MKNRRIAFVEKEISPIVFGTATPALFMAVDKARADIGGCRARAFALLDTAFAAGINCFDCSALYGEEIIGEWIELRGIREETVIISKCAHPNQWRNRVTDFDILYDIHNSLTKLRCNYIDIYMLHRDDPSVPVGRIVDTMNRLYDDGRIGAFGGSNWTHQRLEEANEYAARCGLIPFTVSSPHFGLAEQVNNPWVGQCVTLSGPENAAARKWYKENDVSVFAYSSLARGFFSGSFKSDEPNKVKEILDEASVKGYCCDNNLERLRRAEIMAQKKRCTVAQIALAWLLCQPLPVFALMSSSNEQHIRDSVLATEIVFTDADIKWLNLEKEEGT